MAVRVPLCIVLFYTNSNLPVTKIGSSPYNYVISFTLTQIFQLLKYKWMSVFGINSFTLTQIFQLLKSVSNSRQVSCCFTLTQIFQLLKLACDTIIIAKGFTLTQIFQLLKLIALTAAAFARFTLTQIFQLLKCQIALMKRLPQKTIINISVTTNIIIITYSRAVKKNFLLNVPAPFLPLFR